MTHFAAIPNWMIFVFVMAFMGPAMRYMFGREAPFWLGGKWEGKGRLQKRDAERLDAALAERDAVIEDLQHRLSEMESRLDFTERLIARNPGREESSVP